MDQQERIVRVVQEQREFYCSGATRDYSWRLRQLKALYAGIQKHEKPLQLALAQDLGKSETESFVSEIGLALYELSHTMKHLKKWMRPRKVSTPLLSQPATSRVVLEPLGVNLIIAPFNYPFGLTVMPLIVALAAGNTAVLKSSELTPATSGAIQDLIEDCFEEKAVAYIPGTIPETTLLLEQKFDHIFFTGSARVGSIVMTAAAKQLTPVTLELGGKSPCIVHEDADLEVAARRIVFGKFLNAGQTCVAPDYLLVHRAVRERLIEFLKKEITAFYGQDASQSGDYGRIVSNSHQARLVSFLDAGQCIMGGDHRSEERYIAPTLLGGVSLEDPVMKEEIFGPILPILDYETLDEVKEIVAQLPQHPLALYLFSGSRKVQDQLINEISFGGGCINHSVRHLLNPNLPFGGLGESGMGAYHGIVGFERFSHQKSILKARLWFDPASFYPPFGAKDLKLIRRLFK